MTFLQKLRRQLRSPTDVARSIDQKTDAIVEGIGNQSFLLNSKLEALIEGSSNQSQLLDGRFERLIEGMNNQSELLNSKLEALIKGSDNQSRILNERLNMVIAGLENQSRLLNNKLETIIVALHNQSRNKHDFRSGSEPDPRSALPHPDPRSALPLLIAEKTYNTSHLDYDVTVVRNFPGKILNAELPCENPVYAELKKLAKADEVSDDTWAPVLEKTLAEVKTVPHADLILHRRDALEQYMAELGSRYNARYNPGWVNLDDALFLYWLVRRLKPKTIVQCGVCNGLSSAFMVLALVKNGPDGKLHLIDIPPVFNPKDPAWIVAGKTYGMVIPEGKTSGWMVPEAYRKRFDVHNGDAKLLLPKLVDSLPTIDMFYHDSDHTYNHMLFEFREAKRKLVPGGLIVADDISWNASLWDFADEHAVPAYNFKGAVGTTFF
jgi:predicted O-methyltransferase YrrM